MFIDPLWAKSQLDVSFIAPVVLLDGITCRVGTLYPPLHGECISTPFIRVHISEGFTIEIFLY